MRKRSQHNRGGVYINAATLEGLSLALALVDPSRLPSLSDTEFRRIVVAEAWVAKQREAGRAYGYCRTGRGV